MFDRKPHLESLFESLNVIKRKLLSDHLRKQLISKEKLERPTLSQWNVLRLVRKKGEVSVKEISEALGVTSSASTQLIDGLVNKGYLVRKRDPNDRRIILVKLSPSSQKHLSNMKMQRLKWLTEIFAVLSDEELAHYASLNKKIADSIIKDKTEL